MYVDYWLIGGHFGLASCKLVFFIADVSNLVFIQSLVFIAVDRFGAVLFPLASPRISKSIHALRPLQNDFSRRIARGEKVFSSLCCWVFTDHNYLVAALYEMITYLRLANQNSRNPIWLPCGTKLLRDWRFSVWKSLGILLGIMFAIFWKSSSNGTDNIYVFWEHAIEIQIKQQANVNRV